MTEFSKDIVLDIGSDEFYRVERYQTKLVVMLINSEDKNIFDELDAMLRQVDMIQQLMPEMIVIFLPHISLEDGELFINKINKNFKFTYTLKEYQSPRLTFIDELFQENEIKI